MKDTRKQIIQRAIQLFNEKGLAQVSIRDISVSMGLSPGNFTYHFKTIDDLIRALYQNMKATMDEPHRPDESKSFGLQELDHLLWTAYRFQWAHRFFFTDLVTVKNRFPSILNKHLEVRQERSGDSMALIKRLIKAGLLKKAQYPHSYEALIHSIWLMYPGALSEVSLRGLSPDSNDLPVQLAWNQFLPHLTEEGLKQFKELKNEN